MHNDVDPRQLWEERYGETDRIWSGRPNPRLVEFASDLPPGRALDLGCGEGGDAVWLARRGWQVTAVDIADNALRRAASAAGELADRIDFQRHDLGDSFPDGVFDLVSAQYLHSIHQWDRDAVLRRAAAAVAPGGTLLICDHGAAPPWSKHGHDHVFPSAERVFANLALDPTAWDPVLVGSSEREGTAPDGEQVGTLVDNLIVVRRRA